MNDAGATNDRRAMYALAILTFINLLNYLDRWVVAALVEPIKKALSLTDTQIGVVLSAFIVVFTVTSPIFGRLGDRKARPPLIAFGVAVWSLATGLAGFARGFWTLFLARSTVGVGEAAYGSIAPALLADQFPAARRGRVMAVFFSAIPIGSAAGYVLGGWAEKEFGWRAAFWLAGFPGIVLALLTLMLRDPPRGAQDAVVVRPRSLLANRPYVLAVLGYAAYTFALGGLGSWMPAFLERVRGLPRQEATVTFGGIVVVTGFAGTFLGGFLADWLLPRTKQSYYWVSGLATLLAAPLTLIGLTATDKGVYLTAIVIAEVLIFMCTGPINSAILNAVSPLERATAVGLSVFGMHALGDIPSPILIGAISDATSLDKALLIVPGAIAAAGLVWTYAAWRGEQRMTRRIISALLRFALRIFYRRIELVGLERVPKNEAVVFAVNHPNGLVDPLFLLCFAPRPVSFLAKAPLFGYPIIGWFVKALESIPVYRKQDNTTGTNAETFGQARAVLKRGGTIAIFPEGTTHSDPKLRELKTGAARISLGSNLDVAVIPTGIYYTAKHTFRSSALVMFGEPIRAAPVPVDANGEPPFEEVEKLTQAVDDGLDRVTLQADSHAALELIGRAEDIFTADADQPLAVELDLRRRFIDGYHFLRDRAPQRLARLESWIRQFESELRRAKLDVHELKPRIEPLRLFRMLVLFPLALIGAIVSYPTYRLIGVLSKRYAKGEGAMIATMKFVGALGLYPLTYIALAIAIGWRFGMAWGFGSLIVFPILGNIALHVFEEIDDVIGDARAIRSRLFRRRGYLRLVAARNAIRDEILAVARELESTSRQADESTSGSTT